MLLYFQNVLFYLVSDDFESAKKYIFTENNDKFNIVLPYNGAIKEAGNINYLNYNGTISSNTTVKIY